MFDEILYREFQFVPKDQSTSNAMGDDDQEQFGLIS